MRGKVRARNGRPLSYLVDVNVVHIQGIDINDEHGGNIVLE